MSRSSGEIRGTFFKEMADSAFAKITEGQVYTFAETNASLGVRTAVCGSLLKFDRGVLERASR